MSPVYMGPGWKLLNTERPGVKFPMKSWYRTPEMAINRLYDMIRMTNEDWVIIDSSLSPVSVGTLMRMR